MCGGVVVVAVAGSVVVVVVVIVCVKGLRANLKSTYMKLDDR